MEAEGLPIDFSPLEVAMALSTWEEARPLHKLSLVRIPLNLPNFCRITLTCCSPVIDNLNLELDFDNLTMVSFARLKVVGHLCIS